MDEEGINFLNTSVFLLMIFEIGAGFMKNRNWRKGENLFWEEPKGGGFLKKETIFFKKYKNMKKNR